MTLSHHVVANMAPGVLGTAILSGILSSLESTKHDTTSTEDRPQDIPERFIATVHRPESVGRLKKDLGSHADLVEIHHGDNVRATKAADIIILACKPYMVKDILTAEGMIEALDEKLLISICAGVSVHDIEKILSPDDPPAAGCDIVRAMPNTASQVRQSMTIISTPTPVPAPYYDVTAWIFKQIGLVTHLPASVMDASTALCGSGPAFCALMLEAMADGAVAMGLPRANAQTMAAQTMKGTAELVLNGEHPAVLKDKVCSPGGCTIGGLLVLEEGAVRGTVAKAVREAAVVASLLGKGLQNVNGTRAARD